MDSKKKRRLSSRYKFEENFKSRNLSEKKRRDQFNMLINELCTMVTANSRKMDKSSVLRSTITFLRNHNELSVHTKHVKVPENWKPSFLSNEEFTHLMLEALDGFIIVFSCNGQILYTSESTASLLGYVPTATYSSVFDIIHEMDKSALYKLISSPPKTLSSESFKSLKVHMRIGPANSTTSSSYELVQLMGTFYHWPSSSYDSSSAASIDCDSNSSSSLPQTPVDLRPCFVAVGRLQTPNLLQLANLPDDPKNEFISRHSLEWKFLFLDHRAPPIIGFLPFEVLGTSGYDYYHVDDLDDIAASHELLMTTGEGTSGYYRFLTKGQQWIWLQTRYYISYHQWNSKPEFIVCTHTVISSEKVEKSTQEAPKSFSRHKCLNAVRPSPTSCVSPSSSVSSLGSISSEQSEQRSVKANSSRGVSRYLKHKVISPIIRSPVTTFIEPLPLKSVIQSNSGEIVSNDHQSSFSTEGLQQVNRSSGISPSETDIQCQQNSIPSSSSITPNQYQELLRNRHQALQRQILMHQEELRRISEQLVFSQFDGQVQFAANTVQHGYGAMVQYAGATAHPELHLPEVDGFGRPGVQGSYMNLESELGNIEARSEEISLLSEETQQVITQSYSMSHSMNS